MRDWEERNKWYISDIGGIHQEADGWAFWPNALHWPAIRGLPTHGAAMAEAERLARIMPPWKMETPGENGELSSREYNL